MQCLIILFVVFFACRLIGITSDATKTVLYAIVLYNMTHDPLVSFAYAVGFNLLTNIIFTGTVEKMTLIHYYEENLRDKLKHKHEYTLSEKLPLWKGIKHAKHGPNCENRDLYLSTLDTGTKIKILDKPDRWTRGLDKQYCDNDNSRFLFARVEVLDEDKPVTKPAPSTKPAGTGSASKSPEKKKTIGFIPIAVHKPSVVNNYIR